VLSARRKATWPLLSRPLPQTAPSIKARLNLCIGHSRFAMVSTSSPLACACAVRSAQGHVATSFPPTATNRALYQSAPKPLCWDRRFHLVSASLGLTLVSASLPLVCACADRSARRYLGVGTLDCSCDCCPHAYLQRAHVLSARCV